MENTGAQRNTVTDGMIINRIYVLRGQKVMIDADLAELYQLETTKLKTLITKNTERFPPDFMFEMSREDYQSLKAQDSTVIRKPLVKYFPNAFTEQGLAMLSGLLKTGRSVDVNLKIIRIFSMIRQVLPDYPESCKENGNLN